MRRRTYLGLSATTFAALAGCAEIDDTGATGPTTESEDTNIPIAGGASTPEGATETEEPPEAGTLSPVSEDWLLDTTSFSDTGQAVKGEFAASRFTTFSYAHDGSSEFIVELIDVNNGDTDVLIDEVGAVAGTVGIGLPDDNYLLDIKADGEWSIQIGEPVAPDGEWGVPPATIEGETPDVYGEVEISGKVTVSGQYMGSGAFIVEAYDEANTMVSADERIFDETGAFSGETSARLSGGFYFVVDADGPYQITIE